MKFLILLSGVFAFTLADGTIDSLKETKEYVVAANPGRSTYYSPTYQNPHKFYYDTARTPYEYDLGPYRTFIPGGVYNYEHDYGYNPYYATGNVHNAYKQSALYHAATKPVYHSYYDGGYLPYNYHYNAEVIDPKA